MLYFVNSARVRETFHGVPLKIMRSDLVCTAHRYCLNAKYVYKRLNVTWFVFQWNVVLCLRSSHIDEMSSCADFLRFPEGTISYTLYRFSCIARKKHVSQSHCNPVISLATLNAEVAVAIRCIVFRCIT
jgi:hypothetical protein